MDIKSLGWNDFYEKSFDKDNVEGYTVARVFAEHKQGYKLYAKQGEVYGKVSGKFRFLNLEQGSYPAVGDWVVISIRDNEDECIIHRVLERKSKFSRKVAGTEIKEQIIAANIDTVFLVTALNNDFNARRIERYLIMAWESNANPVIILSKADLCEDIQEKLMETEAVAFGVPIHVISMVEGSGLNELQSYLTSGSTIALLGSSGVGKSSLINYLCEREIQKVNTVREGDERGRHTSTHREMFILNSGAMIVDTPGMREIQLWDGRTGINEAFLDIDEISKNCKFNNCKHKKEPHCAVKEAIDSGELSRDRFESYLKLQKEIRMAERKKSLMEKAKEKKKSKQYLDYKFRGKKE